MKKMLLPILCMVTLIITGCSMPTSYYTNPNSAGYHQQKLGGICERCNKQFTFSGHQLHNAPKIKCFYCGHVQNTQVASLRWVNVKNQRNQQAMGSLMGGVIQGVAEGYASGNRKARESFNSNSNIYKQPNQTHTNACSSDFNCGVGKKCVKKQFSSTGECMTEVDRYGVKTLSSPDPNSIGVNLDEGCNLQSDCPVGFYCNYSYGACVKK